MADTVTLVVKIISDVKSATSGLEEVSSRADKMKQGLKVAGVAATAVLAGLGAAALSAGKAAAEDAQSQAILANALKNNAGASTAAIAATEDWIAAQASATGVADDQLRPALGNLVRATGDVATSQSALQTAMDVSAATGADLESVSKAIAKAYTGNTTSLGKLVPGMDAATLASKDMTAIMGELGDKTGGAAAEAAGTAAGQMAIMQNSIDEAKESIGAGLLPVMGSMAGLLTKVGNFAQEHSTTIQVLAVVIGVLAAAIIAANIAISIWSTVTAVATAAQWAWNAAMAANPLGLIVIAIIAVIAVIVLLWQKSDAFRAAVLATWDAIKTAATAVASAIKSAWEAVWNAIKAGASAVQNFVSAAFNAIQNAVSAVVNWIKGNWGTLVAILTGPIGIAVGLIVSNWDKIKSAFKSVTDFIDSTWDKTVAALKGAVSGLGAILSAPFDAVKGAIQSVIDMVGNLIGKISGIHFPKIPGPLAGLLGASAVVPTPTVAGRSAAPGVPMVGARASTSSALGGVTINVTGAIDPEATARQIRRILDGHTRRVGVAAI